jgi:cell division transport system permease protein
MAALQKRDRALGVSREKRRYDLPLNKGTGGRFLVLLIALMTFLGMLAMAASFALSAMSQYWVQGLENQATIEISAKDFSGDILSPAEMNELVETTRIYLQSQQAIQSITIMSKDDIKALVEPWMGEGLLLGDVPLPAMITIVLKSETEMPINAMQNLESGLKAVVPQARIDTHQEWLGDLLRFTGALQFAAIILTAVIGLTTITAIAGAIRSRMAEYNEEVELLHLMGARDHYISKQFQRYCLGLGFQGGLCGLVFGGLVLMAIGWAGGAMDVNIIPNFSLAWIHIALLCVLPLLLAFIAMITARQTVLSVLRQMP